MHISKKQGTGIVVGVLFVVAIVSFLMPRLSDGRDGGTVSPDENIEVFDSPSVDVGSVNDNLPFRIVGVDSVAPVYEISEISQEAPLDVAWSFGGDFSRIGSFPLSKDSVLGRFPSGPIICPRIDLRSSVPRVRTQSRLCPRTLITSRAMVRGRSMASPGIPPH